MNSGRRYRRHVYNFDAFPRRKWPTSIPYIFNSSVPTGIYDKHEIFDDDDDITSCQSITSAFISDNKVYTTVMKEIIKIL